jgi:hypothetical protein
MLMTYFYTRFHIPSSNYTLVISIVPQAHKPFISHKRIPLIKAAHFSKIYIMSEPQNMLDQFSSCLSNMKLKGVQCLEVLSGCNMHNNFQKTNPHVANLENVSKCKHVHTHTHIQTTQRIHTPFLSSLQGKKHANSKHWYYIH